MKTVTINRDSRLFRFACSWGKWNYCRNADICSFRRALLWGALKAAICIALVLLMYGGLAFSTYPGWVELGVPFPIVMALITPALGAAVIIVVIGVVGFSVAYVADKVVRAIKERRARVKDEPPAPLRAAYLSWKDKYCAKVELK